MYRFVTFQRKRFERIRTMSWEEIRIRLGRKLENGVNPRRQLRRLAWLLHCLSLRGGVDRYEERPEAGPTNLRTKLDRAAQGGPFEPFEIVLVNRAAVELIGESCNLLEVGCGTGMFASLAARAPHRRVTASELEDETRNWAAEHRAAPNINYGRLSLAECATDRFDLAVALEVIEHLADYPAFLADLSRVAPRALLSTPNKNRSALDSIADTPAFSEHVREWTAGELYWVLRIFWDDVRLYTLPDLPGQVRRLQADPGYRPRPVACGILSTETVLLADCSRPRRQASAPGSGA